MIIDSGFQLGCLYEPPLPEAGAAYVRYLSRLLNSPPRLLSQLPLNGDGTEAILFRAQTLLSTKAQTHASAQGNQRRKLCVRSRPKATI